MPWITPVITWLANHIPTKDDFNRIEGNTLHLYENKVDKVDGKGLSTNDYSTTEKNKLAGIEAGATGDMSASEILAAIKTLDGAGSGLDADTLDGNDSSAFAPASHSHSGYAPTSHANAGSTYGLGSPTLHGHVKTINTLTQASHVDGLALSAYQGNVLNQNKSNKPMLIADININFTTAVDITSYFYNNRNNYDAFIIEINANFTCNNTGASGDATFSVGLSTSSDTTSTSEVALLKAVIDNGTSYVFPIRTSGLLLDNTIEYAFTGGVGEYCYLSNSKGSYIRANSGSNYNIFLKASKTQSLGKFESANGTLKIYGLNYN